MKALEQFSGALLDAWVVVDGRMKILQFNRVFYSLFPKNVARKLDGAKLGAALTFETQGAALDLAGDCMSRRSALRYDEIVGRVPGAPALHLIAAAAPLDAADGSVGGAILCLRDVTDEAQVQSKYKTMLDQEARQRELLEQQVRDTRGEMVQLSDRLSSVEAELLDYKKGLLV